MNFLYSHLTWFPCCFSTPVYQSTWHTIAEYRNPDTSPNENYRLDHKETEDGLGLATLGYALGSGSRDNGNEQKFCIKTVTFLTGSATISF